MHTREQIVQALQLQIRMHGHCIGVAAGSGMTARYAAAGGANFILALSAGKFRQAGLGSIASLLSYENSNQLVMDFGVRELLPAVQDTPVFFGLHATDPTIHLYEYLQTIRDKGFAGINNFPTIGMIDGHFRQALEQEGVCFQQEVEAIRIAHFLDLFTLAFVFDETQARAMIEAGADAVCVHLGLTRGGTKGAKRALSLEMARVKMDQIMAVCESLRPGILLMIYGGPIGQASDLQYFYRNRLCRGYIGGSAFERIPVEKAVMETTQAFCNAAQVPDDTLHCRSEVDDLAFIRYYIEKNYPDEIRLSHIADFLHRAPSYLSTKFKAAEGCSFTEYLISYRMDKAAALLRDSESSLVHIADAVGYRDYAQFSKMFKKYKGVSPSDYRSAHAR